MPKDKELVMKKGTFIAKLGDFLKNLFSKERENKESTEMSENRNTQKEEFAKNIKVDENKEMKRLLNLQSMIRNGEIEEKDITKEDEIKLRNLYEKQITNLKKRIQGHRQEIIKIKSKIETKKV